MQIKREYEYANNFDIIYEDTLNTLEGMTLAIDASVLLHLAAKKSNPVKFIQEGGSSLDIQL
jgi:hypothetical protein